MTNELNPLLKTIAALGKQDGAIARCFASRKKLEAQRDGLLKERATSTKESERARVEQLEKKAALEQQIKEVKEEQLTLKGRRTALKNLGSQKTREAGEREIGFAERELEKKLQSLTSRYDNELTAQATAVQTSEEIDKLNNDKNKVNETLLEIDQELAAISEREARYRSEKSTHLAALNPSDRSLYERLAQKFVEGPISFIRSNSCSACGIQLPAQLINQVLSTEKLHRCTGCGRFLCPEA